VLQRSEMLIIKVELVDTIDGSHLWGEQYNRKLSDIFIIEEEISKEISEKLRLKLDSAQKKKLTKRYTENTEAYQLYLKGRYYWNKRTAESLKKGIDYFQQAIDSDPNYALAYAGLADSYNILASYSAIAPKDGFPRAKSAATKALELDDKLAEAHASLAFVEFGYDWDWPECEQQITRAIELNPGYASAHLWHAVFLVAMSRMDEAFQKIKRAQELDPLSLPINTNLGWILYLARRYDEAIEQYQKTLELDSDFVIAHFRLGQAYEQKLMYEEALSEYEKCLALAGRDTETLAAVGHLYARMGRKERALEVINELKALAKSRYIPSYLIGIIYLGLGDMDQTFEWLEKAYHERYGFLAYLVVSPVFDDIRSDSRYRELVRLVGLATD